MPEHRLQPVVLPADFWHRADVINALDTRDMGELFRRIHSRGITQERIATSTGMAQSAVNAYMKNTKRVTALDVFIRIADGLNLPAHARHRLGLASHTSLDIGASELLFDDADDGGSATLQHRIAVPSDSMKRRSLMTWGLAAVGVAAAGSQQRTAKRMSPAAISTLQRRATRLYALDYQHGGDTLWLAACAMAADAYQSLEAGSYKERDEKSLLRAIGRMLMCAGWLAFDAGQHDDARACYNEALSIARQAADADVEAHAFANLAFQSNLLGMPREGLRFANAAARAAAAPDASPHLAAVPQLRTAMALAASSDRSGSDSAITAARKFLDKNIDTPAEEWYAFLSPVELDGVEGTCALTLNSLSRAEYLLNRAIDGHSDAYARNRALYKVRLARVRLEGRVIDGAVQAATSALEDLSGHVVSWRVTSELDQVARRLSAHPSVDGVDAFLHQHALVAANNT